MNRQLQRNKRIEAQAVFNAAGVALASVLVPLGPSWEIKQITISTNVTANLTSATSYVGTNNAGVKISSTLLGNFDTDSQPNTSVRSGEALAVEWVGVAGNSGKVARLTVIYDEVAY